MSGREPLLDISSIVKSIRATFNVELRKTAFLSTGKNRATGIAEIHDFTLQKGNFLWALSGFILVITQFVFFPAAL
jgi:hypothetical protein